MGIPIRSLCVLAVATGGCFSVHDSDDPHDAGADSDAAARCEDADGDGWGEGADCEGPDCDDGDGARHDDCPACAQGATRACYGGAPATEGVGPCHGGTNACDDGAWGPCVGEVVPVDEVCDGADQDCDGAVDDGATFACGTCDATCRTVCAGVDCPAPLVAGEGAAATDNGGIHIADSATDLARHVLWLGDDNQHLVRLVDTRSFEILGAYRVGPRGQELIRGIAVDPRGNAIVPVGTDEAVVRIDASDCADSNGDGVITTSSGADDVLEWDDDDCVRWRWQPAGRDAPFAAAFGPDGKVWIGTFGGETLTRLDPDTGETEDAVRIGADVLSLLGDEGGLWVGNPSNLARVELPAEDTVIVGGAELGSRFLDFDAQGRLLLSAFDRLAWFDSAAEDWEIVEDDTMSSTVDQLGQLWTIPLTPDGRGGYLESLEIRRWNDDFTQVESLPLQVGALRLAADLDGQVWSSSSREGSLSAYDAVTAEHRATLRDECGERCLSGDWLGDVAGVRLHRALPQLVERAETIVPFDIACGDGETGTGHVLTMETDAASPVVDVRGSASPKGVDATPWVLLARGEDTHVPIQLRAPTLPRGATTLQVRVRLRGDGGAVSRVRLEWHCTPNG